jgi:hypothetical protein
MFQNLIRMASRQESVPCELETIPGVGPSIACCLQDLGFEKVGDLWGQDPEKMYADLCRLRDTHIDRCVLYVFRCAVYYAGNSHHDRDKLKWWNWTDKGPCYD